MKFLNVIGTLDPEYGGPVEGLRQWTMALGDLGHSSMTVTLDTPAAPWLAGFPGQICALGPSFGNYRYNTRLMRWLMQNAPQYDAVIVRGIWQYQSLAMWMAARRAGFSYYVFIHGALDPWFKRAAPLKHLKKWIYWPWAEYRVLRDASAVLFTSEEERLLARRSFGLYQVHEAVVGYGIRLPDANIGVETSAFFTACPGLEGKRILLFMSRIHPKKGTRSTNRRIWPGCGPRSKSSFGGCGPRSKGTAGEPLQAGERAGNWRSYHVGGNANG